MIYGEITIIQNLEKESFFRTLGRIIIGFEGALTDDDFILVIFENKPDKIYDAVKYDNVPLTYFNCSYVNPKRIYTEKDVLYYKEPSIKRNGEKILHFKHIFSGYSKYNCNQVDGSFYNMVYEDSNENPAFSLLKIKSSDIKPRYLLAYDDKYLNKKEVLSLINSIFKNKC